MKSANFFLTPIDNFYYFCRMKLAIKNMVCNHCVSAVRQALTELGLTPVSVELGRAEIVEDLTNERLDQLAARLEASGFELISDPTKDIVESIKREIIMMVRSDEPVSQKLSDYLSAKLNRDFRALSRIFSDTEGRTIENYLIMQKIERVKELLLDGELNVSEIAYRTGYSSVAHLSRQFKEITGMTPSDFRRDGHRLPLNEV